MLAESRLLLLALMAGPVAAQPNDLDWIDFDRIADGEIVLETASVGRGTVRIDLAVAIESDWETIWELLTACEISPEFVPHVIACRRVASLEECDCELFEQTVKPAFFLPRFDHVFKLEYFPPERIEVSHVSGPIDQMDGAWRLIQRPDEPILLIHSMVLNPGLPVPRMFVRNTLRRDLPTVLREIRSRAESTPER